MRSADLAAGVAAIAFVASMGTATPAYADDFGVALNGTFLVMSDGEWAKKSIGPHGAGGADVFRDDVTVVQTWTVSTDCVSPIECTGTVSSDRGWTAPIRLDDFWYVDRDIPNWMPCPNGTFAPGHQKFMLWGMDPSRNERLTKNLTFLAGRDMTKTASGACGRNQTTSVEMPVKMQKLS
ncbi:putative secreted protein [Mycolicibacterium flavescens]|uniref:hypothetical protein n=1 Tax=Mycobacterium neumannii TaxID=2048551 RepID=UPI000B93A38A|nr:hypothetical protein [Mycobacterium neumannii]VEG39802.1 putative secreted protein [Mycolicibacterium flavescens]